MLDKIQARRNGLSQSESVERLAAMGANTLPTPEPPSEFSLFVEQFQSLPVFLLLGSSVLSLTTRAFLEAGVTIAVVIANAVVGYSTESTSQRTILSMTKRSSWPVRVRRDNAERDINSEDIVPGDVLVLQPGAILPADARIVSGTDLMVNEALLTGESEAVEKTAMPVHADAPLAEHASMARRGTFVASGTGEAVVVATGANTEIGWIEQQASTVRPPPTILEEDLGRLGSQLALLSGLICVGVFGIGVLRQRPLPAMFKSAVALAVAAVPEGLPAIATTTLALELQRLRKKQVIVRRLHALEGLGAVNTLCFDKTGTLTENKMSVSGVLLGHQYIDAAALPAAACGAKPSDIQRLLETGVLCSDVEFIDQETGIGLTGSGTECAIVEFAQNNSLDGRALQLAHPRLDAQHRTEGRRMMATLHLSNKPDHLFIAAKGDPQTILDRCLHYLADGQITPCTDEIKDELRSQMNEMASKGLRVLGLAFAEPSKNAASLDCPLTWIGAVGLADPLRDGTSEVIGDLHRAGIRTVMITGDQSSTARTIATKLGLSNGEPLQILDANDLAHMPDELLKALAAKTHVFARVNPTQKLDIVRALQDDGNVVGMTGDGFNDAPAMKAADIAIAVGENSAGAARDVADVVIAGEHIRHIVDGIAYGRTVQANVRKSVHFMLSTNLSEIFVVLAETLNRSDEIESPLELLWLNLVTDILPGLGLALEPPAPNVMSIPPEGANSRIINSDDIKQSFMESAVTSTGALLAHGYGLARYGPGPQTRAITLFTLITSQLLQGFSCRTDRRSGSLEQPLFSNSALNMAIGGAFSLQALPLLWPAMRRVLGIGPMGAADLAVTAATGLATFGAIRALPKPKSNGLDLGGDLDA